MKESAENYLETILLIENQAGKVKSVDVARALSVTKPSVSRAMGKLKDMELIEMDENSWIVLTKKGRKQAKAILDRHETVTQFLMMTTDVSQEIAEENACKIGHFLSDDVFAGIKNFIKQVEEYNDEN